ncbi:hypothetical protein QZH41_009850 [Actinostola sp. cb2023]|nr:hypothetical protein QZH41_009850 [Actinostola sp. cb2023]
MSDSEYSSDDDEDYVPEFESGSDEGDVEGQEEKPTSKNKSAKKKPDAKRKQKGGIKLEDDEDDNNEDDDDDQDDEFEQQERMAKEKKKQEEDEKAKRARMEDLWASFKSDTANVRAKSTNPSTSTKAASLKAESTSLPAMKGPKDAKPVGWSGKASTSKVTITKTFDFAGEAVTVTKTVDAGSDEAKKAQKEEVSMKPTTAAPVSASVKRKGGLSNLLGQIGKKPKISTLEKSKLDWENFKTETGIADDLKIFNKNGYVWFSQSFRCSHLNTTFMAHYRYLERQDFLQRTDERLFEREKETRATMRKQ